MKKSFLVGLFLAFSCIQNGFSGCNTPHTITFKGNQKPEHNEFLYENKYQYDASVEGYKNTRTQNSGAGVAYECDRYHSSGCTKGEYITMPKGHWFKGAQVDHAQRYKCDHYIADDLWVATNDDCNCCNSLQFGDIPVGGAYSRNLSKAECSAYEKTDETHGTSFRLECREDRKLLCRAVACDNPNMSPNSNGVCVEKKKPADTCSATIKGQTVVLNRGAESSIDLTAAECSAAVKVAHGGASFDPNGRYHFYCGPMCKKVGCQSGYENDENGMCVKKGNKKTCREQRAGMSIEAIACCDTGTDATWDKPIKGKCNCKDSNTHFEIVGGRGQCVANVTPPIIPPVIIPPTPVIEPCSDPDNMDSNCKCVVPETVERNGKCVCLDSDKVIKNGKCEYSDEYLGKLEIELDNKYSGLTAMIGGFKKNVWRDENGEFNTARLASDSIAGVVLGTVGGIVTANLVKKAQLKQGFEDIGCYIGGQSVAGYGDEFYVGR